MGSSSSKFKKYLQHGDEYAAMQVYQSSSDLRKALQPNFSYGDHHNHNTPLHYASRHGMKHLIRTFINDLDGNPNKRNSFRQTSLHCVCDVKQQKSPSALERRAYSVILLLSWRGPFLSTGERERMDVNARDNAGNTALHYAAQSGLGKCVEYLVAHGSDLFIENKEGLTACDLAMRENDHRIAQFLESKMVFSGTPESASGESSGARASSFDGEEEVYCGLRAQDLQEAKDQLLVETADMLHIPLFTAEALLRHSEWSRENLLEHWMQDPIQTCQLAGVQPPFSALRHSSLSQFEQISSEYHDQTRQDYSNKSRSTHSGTKSIKGPTNKALHPTPKIHSENSFIVDEELAEEGLLCEICCDLMTPRPVDNEMSCGHRFCTRCWKNYLHNKIQEGNTHNILCPAYECEILVPNQVIECYVSPQMARKFLKFDINAFVETKKDIKWCPFPSCQRAVNLPTMENEVSGVTANIQVSHAVDCGGGHFFCWECGSEAHAPAVCHLWRMWLNKCARVNPGELTLTSQDYQDAANCLWLITNSKPCPNCQSPIQKNDGCNHIKCSKCKHDFCWVCLESWKKHSTATGGYFRCNRYTTTPRVDEGVDKQLNRMGEKTKRLRELNRFVHYYTRYKNHENSRHMEEPLLPSARRKRELLESSLERNRKRRGGTEDRQPSREILEDEQDNILSRNTKFYEDGVWELVKARLILAGSYAYGFYLSEDNNNGQPQNQSRVAIFEFMQNELEEMTERLSEMIARPYLRTPRRTIIQTFHLCRRKRQEFLRACYRGLVPPEPNSIEPLRVHHQANLAPSSHSGSTHTNYSTPLRSREINSMVGLNIDRNRLVECINDDIYGSGPVWKRDDKQMTAGRHNCSKCRRPSCTTQMCISSSELHHHREKHDTNFMSLRREKPNVTSGSFSLAGNNGGTRSGPRALGNRRHTEYVSSSNTQREGNLDLMMAVELSHMQMNPDVRGNGAPMRAVGPRSSKSDDNILSSSLGTSRLDIEQMSLSSSKEELRQINMAIELSLNSDPKPGREEIWKEQVYVSPRKSEGSERLAKRSSRTKESQGEQPDDNCASHKDSKVKVFPAEPRQRSLTDSSNETVSSFLKSLTIKEAEEDTYSVSPIKKSRKDSCSRSLVQDHSSSPSLNDQPPLVKRSGEIEDGRFKVGEFQVSSEKEGKSLEGSPHMKRSQSLGDMEDEAKPQSASSKDRNSYTQSKESAASEQDQYSGFVNVLPRNESKSLASKKQSEDNAESIPTNVKVGSATRRPSNIEPKKEKPFVEGATNAKIEDEPNQQIGEQPTGFGVTSALVQNSAQAPSLANGQQKRVRPRFVRQKSFEIDSDSTDVETSYHDNPMLRKSKSAGQELTKEVKEVDHFYKISIKDETSPTSATKVKKPTKKPGLTIKIENSSFIEDSESELDALAKSPTFHISGVSISRSPASPGMRSPQKGANVGHSDSPIANQLSGCSSPSLVDISNRYRSSSLVVPPPSSLFSMSPASPGSKSLHLCNFSTSPRHHSRASPNTSKFLFPPHPMEPGNVNPDSDPAERGLGGTSFSSVLHIHDSYLSSDDFHEALFLEKSPKAVKRKRKSKKSVTIGGTSSVGNSASSLVPEQAPSKENKNLTAT